ncbi:YkvA family protein [Palleronia marisminoris]|uniref:YkvA family protein n=1 Tax=Palleronia marisminoris TaxID=315423 RepID=UPI0023EA68D0|nr:YkvA family protein [Palleronia marisminoris]
MVAACVAAYAFSPIDLISDFIPVLGLLDDAILLPFGILIAVRLIPAPLMKEIRETAARRQERPMSRSGMIAIFALWLAAAGFSVWLMLK